jgi:pimeloyl-ACP methyl ester carboxylesterase
MSVERFTVRRGDVELSGLRGGKGAGELVVLLHGLAGSAAEMVPLGEALGKPFVALDQRGHGLSTRRPTDLSRRAFVDADVMEAVMRPVADEARWDAWERIAVPTLLIRGADDDVDPAEAERMGTRARSETVIGAGHDVHLEKGDVTARLIRRFIGG